MMERRCLGGLVPEQLPFHVACFTDEPTAGKQSVPEGDEGESGTTNMLSTSEIRQSFMNRFPNLIMKKLILISALLAPLVSVPAQADGVINGFQGPYAPANWIFSTNGNGSVNTALAPASITLTGNSNYVGGNTDYVSLSHGQGNVSFDWTYSAKDYIDWDQFYYLKNSVPTFITDNAAQGSGSTVFAVLAGDTFGFRIYSRDGEWGPGIAFVSDFSAPVPSPLPVVGAVAAFSSSRRLRHLSSILNSARS